MHSLEKEKFRFSFHLSGSSFLFHNSVGFVINDHPSRAAAQQLQMSPCVQFSTVITMTFYALRARRLGTTLLVPYAISVLSRSNAIPLEAGVAVTSSSMSQFLKAMLTAFFSRAMHASCCDATIRAMAYTVEEHTWTLTEPMQCLDASDCQSDTGIEQLVPVTTKSGRENHRNRRFGCLSEKYVALPAVGSVDHPQPIIIITSVTRCTRDTSNGTSGARFQSPLGRCSAGSLEAGRAFQLTVH